jgi:FkbM family methyltransferase
MNERLKRLARTVLPRSIVDGLQARRHVPAHDPELELLPALARGRTFVDVGANRGTWTLPASRMFAEVHAFEPVAAVAEILRQAAPANVTVHELALSDHEGTGRFAVPIYQGRAITTRATLEDDVNVGFDDETVHEVRLARLDSLGLRDIDVVKIDVEGHEGAAIEGARETIDRERPSLVVEIEERHHAGQSEAIIERLTSRGYLCCYPIDGRIELFRPGSIDALQPSELITMPGHPKASLYINNFFFVPAERSHEIEAMERILTEGRR